MLACVVCMLMCGWHAWHCIVCVVIEQMVLQLRTCITHILATASMCDVLA